MAHGLGRKTLPEREIASCNDYLQRILYYTAKYTKTTLESVSQHHSQGRIKILERIYGETMDLNYNYIKKWTSMMKLFANLKKSRKDSNSSWRRNHKVPSKRQ